MATVTKQGGRTIYQVDQPEPLVCPKCRNEVDYLLGEEEHQACENCYAGGPAAEPDAGEVIGAVVGEQNQMGELRGESPYPTAPTQVDQLKDIIGGK